MGCTGNDVYCQALAYLFEEPGYDADFRAKAPGLISALAAEALPYENSWRAARGKDELERAPVVDDLDDVIDYCDYICRVALPFGLCADYFRDECDEYKSQDFRGRFLDALVFASSGCVQDIEDMYS